MSASRNLHKSRLVDFHERYEIVDRGFHSPCHEWRWNVSNAGYGRHGAGNKMWLAHRYAYVLAHGSIPDGLSIDHLCRNRLCVNPDHLDAVTLAENTRRQHLAAPPKKGPRCDHDQEPDWKNCRICARRRRAAYRDRLRAAFGTCKVVGGFSKAHHVDPDNLGI